MTVYLLWDDNECELVSVHKSMSGARETLVEFLENETGYTPEEWKEFANNNGYDSVEEFKDALRIMPDYDEEMQVRIECETLLE